MIKKIYRTLLATTIFIFLSYTTAVERVIAYPDATISISGDMNEAYNDIFQKLEEKWIFSDPVTARECLPGAIRVLNPLRHNELSLSVYDFFRNLWANHIDICTPPYLKPVIVVVGSDEDFLETQNTLIQSLRLPPSFELNILQHDVSTTSMSADLSERIITDTRSDYLISIQHHEDEDNDRSFWSIVIYDMVDRVSLELQESELETVIEKIKQYIISVESLNSYPEWKDITLSRIAEKSTARLYDRLNSQVEVLICIPSQIVPESMSFKILTHWNDRKREKIANVDMCLEKTYRVAVNQSYSEKSMTHEAILSDSPDMQELITNALAKNTDLDGLDHKSTAIRLATAPA